MIRKFLASSLAVVLLVSGATTSAQSTPIVEAKRVDNNATALPLNTLVLVTPANEITSKKMKEGTKRKFLVVEDVVYDGYVVIPRGSPVEATVTWRTGKGIVGKSAKFELSFDWVRVGSHNWKLRGAHRQEGKGNTAGALLGAAIITGRSAVMTPGQVVNVFTDEPIPFRSASQPEPKTEEPSPDPAKAEEAPATAKRGRGRPPAELKISTKSD